MSASRICGKFPKLNGTHMGCSDPEYFIREFEIFEDPETPKTRPTLLQICF